MAIFKTHEKQDDVLDLYLTPLGKKAAFNIEVNMESNFGRLESTMNLTIQRQLEEENKVLKAKKIAQSIAALEEHFEDNYDEQASDAFLSLKNLLKEQQ